MANELNNKKCFIITPIGSTESEIRRATEGLIEAVIIPTLNELGFTNENISVAHRISESGSINRQIIKRIIEDDLAIVNLTGLNPNVMYELAVRHAIAKPVIMLAEDGTRLPFDIVDQRTIFYKDDMLGAVQLKEDLKTFVKSALNDTQVENPLISLIQENNALNNVSSIDKGAAELILDRIDRLERKTVPRVRPDLLRIEFSYDNNELERTEATNLIENKIFNSSLSEYINDFEFMHASSKPAMIFKGVLRKPIQLNVVRNILNTEVLDESSSFSVVGIRR